PSGMNFLDRSTVGNNNTTAGWISHFTVGLAVAAPPLFDLLDVGTSRAFSDDFIIYVETMAVNTVLTQLANFAAARPRPAAYVPGADLSSTNNYLSFWSGHASNTVAALSAAAFTLRLRYGEIVSPWAVTGLVGTSVPAERVLAASHFPTHVTARPLAGLA